MPRNDPLPDIGEPDLRSPRSYLLWLLRRQAGTASLGVFWGCLWMAGLGLTPLAVGRAVDAIAGKDTGRLAVWAGAILGLALVTTAGSVLRHRCDTVGRLKATYLTIRLVARQAVRLGARLRERVTDGDMVTVGTADISRIGALPGAVARGAGSAVTIVVVAVVLLSTSLALGLLVLLGVPVLLAVTGPLLRPLHRRVGHYRHLEGELTVRAADIVAGLRVLRGIGGEQAFGERYRTDSQRLRRAGVEVARVESVLPAAEVLLPGVLVVAVVWVGARLAVSGDISAGDLVAAYGYAAFLMLPMRTVTSAVQVLVAANVAAARVVRVLAVAPDPTTGGAPVELPDAPDLVDAATGLTARHGRLTAVVSASPEESTAIAERLGRYRAGAVTLGAVPLETLPVEQVRRDILLVQNSDTLFSGVLRDELAADSTDEELAAALHAAGAEDVVAALPNGVYTVLAEQGATLSGGQRQRLRLARALASRPPVLVLVDPTSAVDAHTEASVAERLQRARAGRTTVVMSASPLILDRADDVAFVAGGKVVRTGTHRELLTREPRYAATVLRDGT
ncbi:ABC transporter ATP-binding protein [Streptomyces actinomycinicus]|uniref:ABC transporter ATP-binding protein n=1 Tax=Streptomyces actinomycinicus TaxID=1695166 RepID=A0A937EHL6_9ACTN|nr:ABC transporter ATP-binding protein [Streptomyces actinomycinicus]MBL1082321.1 ABC transporter ATP-binding protein [Streptomyces actinomycinicus]